MDDKHLNIRDEQFWFTAAVVGFNSLVMGNATVNIPACYVIAVSATVSLFGAYLILDRWVDLAGRRPPYPPSPKSSSLWDRLSYSLRSIYASLLGVPYVLAEMSGSCFYLLLMAVTFIGVVITLLAR